jgi:hypothetical protein
MLVSPSLDGILRHDSIVYEGVHRPREVLRAFDSPSSTEDKIPTIQEYEILSQYFQDIYSVFMKKLSYFMVEIDPQSVDIAKIQALLQEMIKVKKLIARVDTRKKSVDVVAQ